MNKGTLSFAIDDQNYGVAFQDDKLKQGPIYPAVAVLRKAGCKLRMGIPAPEYFK